MRKREDTKRKMMIIDTIKFVLINSAETIYALCKRRSVYYVIKMKTFFHFRKFSNTVNYICEISSHLLEAKRGFNIHDVASTWGKSIKNMNKLK